MSIREIEAMDTVEATRAIVGDAAPVARAGQTQGRCSVEEIGDVAGLDAFAHEWDAFSARAEGALLFNAAAWIRAWWLTLAGKTHPGSAHLRVLVVRDGAAIRGIAPLWMERRSAFGWTYRIARFAAEGPSDHADVLIEGPPGPVMDALAAHLERMRCDAVEMREWFGPSPHRAAWVDALRRRGWGVDTLADSACHFVPAGTAWEEYLPARFSGKRRRDHAWTWRRLEQAGPVQAAFGADAGDVRELADRLADVQADRSFADAQRTGEFNDARFRPFIERVLEAAKAHGWLRLTTMERGAQLVAYFLSFHYRGRYYVYNTAHRHGDRDAGAGRMLMLYMLERMMREGGGVIDFLRGSEAFKETFAADVIENRRVHAWRPGVRGTVARALLFSAVPALERTGRRWSRAAAVGLTQGWRGLAGRALRRLSRNRP